MSIQHAAAFAEVLVSPDYRDTVNTAFEQSPEDYMEQQQTAKEIILNAIKAKRASGEQAWEARRQAAITEARGTDLGPFDDYIQERGGYDKPAELTIGDLDKGKPEVVRSNSRIMGLGQTREDPIDFLELAVDMLDSRKKQSQDYVGPENYAAALKFFADKFRDFPSDHLDKSAVKGVVNRCLQGFMYIAETDKPNFVEMTNIYAAIKALPFGTIDEKFSRQLTLHSLEQLPTYNKGTINVMLSALGKLDLSQTGESSAVLVDLALRKGRSFDTTRDMLFGLRVVSNLPRTPAANRCFETFLETRNNLEQPMDIESIEYVNAQLLHVVRDVIDNPDLSQGARELASKCTILAIGLYRRAAQEAAMTDEQDKRMRAAVRRISDLFNQI